MRHETPKEFRLRRALLLNLHENYSRSVAGQKNRRLNNLRGVISRTAAVQKRGKMSDKIELFAKEQGIGSMRDLTADELESVSGGCGCDNCAAGKKCPCPVIVIT